MVAPAGELVDSGLMVKINEQVGALSEREQRGFRELATFGCTLADLEQFMENALGHKAMIVMGMMSDAQEQIRLGHAEDARQTLNRAKWIVSEYLMGDLL